MTNGWFTHTTTGEKLYRFVPAGETVQGFAHGRKVMWNSSRSHGHNPNGQYDHPWTVTAIQEMANGDLIVTCHSDRFVSDSTYGWSTMHKDGWRLMD